MPKNSFYHLDVAPLSVLPINRSQIFSYQSRLPVKTGSLIRIPFGSREIEGVVYSAVQVAGRPPAWMKRAGPVKESAFLSETQRALAQAISAEYFAPLGKTLRHFVPKRMKARKLVSAGRQAGAGEKIIVSEKEKTFLEAYRKLAPGESAFYQPDFVSESKRLLILLAKKTLREKKQILVLVPEITLFPGLKAQFDRYFPRDSLAFLHSKLPGGEYFDAWERIRSGQARIILATRHGIFAPFQHLGLVVLTEEDDPSYKQWDMSPRYDARRAARTLAGLSGARILFSSPAPSLDVFRSVEEKMYSALTPLFPEGPLGEAVALVNLKFERFQKNASPLSKNLQEKIRLSLAEKKQVLLYVERQGLSFFSVCESCKNIFRCPRCARALKNTSFGYFHCQACGYKTALFPSCPTCRHLGFRHIGFGTHRIERETKKIFPQARIFRADSSTMQKREAAEELYRRGQENEIDILIGTQMILNDPPLPKLSLVAIIDADSLLTFPDFRADERYFGLLSRTAAMTNGKKDSVLVQTFHPESTLNQRLTALAPLDIYRDMLDERQALRYPPSTRAILLVCRDRRASVAKSRALAVQKALEKILKKTEGKLTPLTDEPKYLKKERLYEYRFSLMVPDGDMLPPALTDLLLSLAPFCRVDVDPLTLY